MDVAKFSVHHATDRNCFEITIQGRTAVLDYTRFGSMILFTHSGVPSALEGQGIGSKLARAGLEYARENSLTVRTTCWFVRDFLKRHPEYNDLLEAKTAE